MGYKIKGIAAGNAILDGKVAEVIYNEKSGAQHRVTWHPLPGAALPKRGDTIEETGIGSQYGVIGKTVKCNGKLISAPDPS